MDNYTNPSEVMVLAAENKIRHKIKLFKLDEINENLESGNNGRHCCQSREKRTR